MHWKRSPLARLSRRFKGTAGVGPGVAQLNRLAARQWYRLHDRFLTNPASRKRFAVDRPTLDEPQQRVVKGLEASGVAVLPLTDFFPHVDGDLWARLLDEATRFTDRVESDLAARQAKATTAARRGGKTKGLGKGDYIIRLLSKNVPTLRGDDPWLRLAVSDRLLAVVNSYFGLWSKLTYVDLWYTPPAAPGVPRVSSQRWHRDYNDTRLVKVFIYLTDVDESGGPLEYVPGSARGGDYAREWPWRAVGNELYPPQDVFERRIPRTAQRTLTGPAGTMIFCNTSGFHRGGYATGNRPRVMAVYNYVSPASLAALTLRNFAVDVSLEGLSEPARWALT